MHALPKRTTWTKIWHRWGKWFQVIVTLVLFGYLFKKTPVIEALLQWRNAHIPFVVISLILVLLSLVIYAYAWTRTLQILRLSMPFGWVCSLFFQAQFINNFATFLGGDLARGYKLGQATKRPVDVWASVLVSRVAMLSALLMLAGATTWGWGRRAGWDEGTRWAGIVLVTLTLLSWLGYRWPVRRIANLLMRYRNVHLHSNINRVPQLLLAISDQFKSFLTICLLSLFAQLVSLWAVWWLAVGLDLAIAWWQILVALSVLRVVLVLPISFNGLGLREVGLVGLLTNMGVDESEALALALGISLSAVLSSLPGGLSLLKEALTSNSADLSSCEGRSDSDC